MTAARPAPKTRFLQSFNHLVFIFAYIISRSGSSGGSWALLPASFRSRTNTMQRRKSCSARFLEGWEVHDSFLRKDLRLTSALAVEEHSSCATTCAISAATQEQNTVPIPAACRFTFLGSPLNLNLNLIPPPACGLGARLRKAQGACTCMYLHIAASNPPVSALFMHPVEPLKSGRRVKLRLASISFD
jgi:hypothetical protein